MTCGSWCSSRRALRVLIAIGLVMGATLSASAQQPTSEQISAIRASCRSDFMSNCTGVKPGTRDALECLKRNAAKVSPSCKTALDAISPRPTESAAPAPAKTVPPPAPLRRLPPPRTPPPPAAAAPPPPAAPRHRHRPTLPSHPPPRRSRRLVPRRGPRPAKARSRHRRKSPQSALPVAPISACIARA